MKQLPAVTLKEILDASLECGFAGWKLFKDVTNLVGIDPATSDRYYTALATSHDMMARLSNQYTAQEVAEIKEIRYMYESLTHTVFDVVLVPAETMYEILKNQHESTTKFARRYNLDGNLGTYIDCITRSIANEYLE